MKEDISFLSDQGKNGNQKKKKKPEGAGDSLEYSSPEIQEGEALETPGHSAIGSSSTLPPSFDLGSLPEDRLIEAYRINWFNRILDWWSMRKKKKNAVGPTAPARNITSPVQGKTGAIAPATSTGTTQDINLTTANQAVNDMGLNILGNSSVLETNLIEGGSSSFFDWQKQSSVMVLSVLITASLVALLYAGLSYWDTREKMRLDAYRQEIDSLTARLDKVKEETRTYGFLGDKIMLVDSLLNKHIYWTNFFRFLEAKTISDIYFLSFTGDTSGVYELSGYAKRYDDLTKQLEVFKKDKDNVLEATISGGKMEGSAKAAGSSSISFTLKLTLNKNLFTAHQ